LRQAIDSYIERERSLGMGMRLPQRVLGYFCKRIGNVNINTISFDEIRGFVGDARKPGIWSTYYSIIDCFFRYALGRGWIKKSPFPPRSPKFPEHHPAHIYSIAELRALVTAAKEMPTAYAPLRPITYATLLLLLYGAGIRIGEALRLSLSDVDFVDRVITVRETKFHKSRLVPIGPNLTRVLADYSAARCRCLPTPAGRLSRFFCTRSGRHLPYTTVWAQFDQLCRATGVRGPGSWRGQPRIHDIRHTSATHHLIAWYRAGKDVQLLLPRLATYLGHVSIESTQRYLSLTPELLQEASKRFHGFFDRKRRRA
jgi:integrase